MRAFRTFGRRPWLGLLAALTVVASGSVFADVTVGYSGNSFSPQNVVIEGPTAVHIINRTSLMIRRDAR